MSPLNFSRCSAALASETNHLISFVSAQNRYNLLERDIRRDLIPACERLGMGILPFYPLASGLLTGKYRRGEPPPTGTRLTSGIHFYEGVLDNADWDLIEGLTDFAAERGHTILELAIGWLASQPAVACVMTGATHVDQIEQNAKSADWRLTPGEMRQVDEILNRSQQIDVRA